MTSEQKDPESAAEESPVAEPMTDEELEHTSGGHGGNHGVIIVANLSGQHLKVGGRALHPPS